jgi:signal transduction histidine kinase
LIGKQLNSRFRMVFLNLILPINLILLMLVLFIQFWFLQFNVRVDDLEAKRFLINPLQEVVSEKEIEEKNIPEWVTFIALEDGTILYPFNGIDDEILSGKTKGDEFHLSVFISTLVTVIPKQMNMIHFTYKGQKGLCFYRNNLLPHPYRILQKPGYLIYLFLISMSFFISGMIIMISFEKNIEKLIQAAKRIRGMDLDTPINLKNKQNNEFSEVVSAFEDMRVELKENRAQGVRIIMSITHDLKTPLTSMRMYLEAMHDGIINTPEEGLKAIDIILQKSSLLEERIDEMLDFSKGMSSGQGMIHETIVVEDWTRNMLQYFEEECRIKDRFFSVQNDLPENLLIKGNIKMLDRAVMNLFDNACRYSSKSELIRISLSVSPDHKSLVLIMEDSGPGVALEDRGIIFELFFRKDKGRNTRGMGIGLASVKFVVENHGGTVSCDESSLGGAKFEIHLPFA